MPVGIYVPSFWNDLASDVNVGTPAQGAVPYFGGTHWNALAAGTSGQLLASGGPAANPSWISSSTLAPNPGSVILAPGSSTRNLIQPAGDFTALLIRADPAQTANLFEIQDSAAAAMVAVGSQGFWGIGTPVDPLVQFKILGTVTTTGSSTVTGFRGSLQADPAGASSATFQGSRLLAATVAGNVQTFTGQLQGGNFTASHGGTATLTSAFGGVFIAQKSSTGPVTNAIAGDYTVNNTNATGAISSGIGIRVSLPLATGAITTLEAIRVRNQGAANVTTVYGLHIDNQTGATTNNAIVTEGGVVRFLTGAAGVAGPVIRGAASQTADLLRIENSASRRLFTVPAAGDLIFYRDSSTPAERQAADITVTFATATDATRKARAVFNIWDTAVREAIRIESNGTAPMIGFLGATAVVRQTGASAAGIAAITDASAKAAVTALQTALANLGLVTSPA